ELHELQPPATGEPERPGEPRPLSGSSRSSLHAKTYMADGRKLFVGSLNLDPRSAFLNTEMGVVIESGALCTAVRSRLLGRLPDIAYRVELDKASGRMAWITRDGGKDARYEAEPDAGGVRR